MEKCKQEKIELWCCWVIGKLTSTGLKTHFSLNCLMCLLLWWCYPME